MKTTVNGRGVSVTDPMRQTIEKKVSRFDKFFREPAEAQAVLRSGKRDITVEITIAAGGMLYRSEQSADAWQTALDRCVEHIERQIRKNKTRLEKRLRDTFQQTPATISDIEEEGEFVIHEKRFSIKPMSAEEAILQMNLLGHSFFVYKDDVTGEINVVYRRKDGEYGHISDCQA